MKKQLAQVAEFHRAFNIPILGEGERPTQERIELRKKLILEEFNELKEAHESGNIEHVAKEACDLVYVCLGTVLEFGWQENEDMASLLHDFGGISLFCEMDLGNVSFLVKQFLAHGDDVDGQYCIDTIIQEIEDYLRGNMILKYFERCFTEVHRSNMSKLGANGKPVYRADGKVLKSELYSPADLSFLSQVAV